MYFAVKENIGKYNITYKLKLSIFEVIKLNGWLLLSMGRKVRVFVIHIDLVIVLTSRFGIWTIVFELFVVVQVEILLHK